MGWLFLEITLLVASPRAELTLAVPRDVHESGISLDRKTE